MEGDRSFEYYYIKSVLLPDGRFTFAKTQPDFIIKE